MICVICNQKIKGEDNYFKIELYSEYELVGKDFAHKLCWNKQKNTEELVKKANQLVGAILQ